MQTTWLQGFRPFDEVLAEQERLVQIHVDDPSAEDELLLLEHEPVYTIGRTRDTSSLHPQQVLPHPVRVTNRGGQATYHGPGQLVGYPITDLNRRGRDLHLYVLGIETTLIRACADFGVQAGLREGLVGVWVEKRKLASIGVGVKKWIAMHGFALNIRPESLPPFLAITPCGIQGVTMTCLANERSQASSESLLVDFGNCFSAYWSEFLSTDQNS
jgi:lipoyl(octanoyl) transferase